MKKYNKDNIQLAKELRNNMTPWEKNYGTCSYEHIPYVSKGKRF